MEKHAYFWIKGKWGGAGPDSARVGYCIDPVNGEKACSFSDASEGDVDEAIEAARSAFDETRWSHSPSLRAQVLLGFADRLEDRRADIERWLTLVNGKLVKESVGELSAAISELRFYAGVARTIFSRSIETNPGCFSHLLREPLGVAGIITPWNGPITLLVRSLAPALAAGCTAVIKVAPQTSFPTALTLQCLADVGLLPSGVVNFFTETGSAGAELLVRSPSVDMISFTGSNLVGKHIMAVASGTMKRLSLELGGKSPSIIFPDADLDKATKTLTGAATVMAGQMCTAASRVLVHDSVAGKLRQALTKSLGAVRVGPGADPDSDMGPLIDRKTQARVGVLIQEAADQGKMHVRGSPLAQFPKGAFLTPTLVEIRDLSSKFIQEEIFGPFLVFETFTDTDEAVSRANATRYGLAASVWTSDRERAETVSRQLASGTVWINSYNKHMAEAETGGYRESGLGRLHGIEAMNDFLQTKHVYYENALADPALIGGQISQV